MKRRLVCLATALAVTALIMSPFSVFAATISGSTIINGSVPASLSLTPPDTFSMPTLNPNTTVESSAQNVKVSTNISGWSLTVAQNGGGSDGKMIKNGGGSSMTKPMNVKGGDLSTYTPLSATVTLKNGTGGPGNNLDINNIYFQQEVTASEPAGNYSITVVFTASGAG